MAAAAAEWLRGDTAGGGGRQGAKRVCACVLLTTVFLTLRWSLASRCCCLCHWRASSPIAWRRWSAAAACAPTRGAGPRTRLSTATGTAAMSQCIKVSRQASASSPALASSLATSFLMLPVFLPWAYSPLAVFLPFFSPSPLPAPSCHPGSPFPCSYGHVLSGLTSPVILYPSSLSVFSFMWDLLYYGYEKGRSPLSRFFFSLPLPLVPFLCLCFPVHLCTLLATSAAAVQRLPKSTFLLCGTSY